MNYNNKIKNIENIDNIIINIIIHDSYDSI